MVKHIVLWRLKDFAEGADKASNAGHIKVGLEGLRGRIPGLVAIEVGVNFEPSPAAFDVALYSVFESREALAAYQAHPEHAKVADFILRVRSERVVADYEVP
jgi:hypothetical protein